LAPTKNFSFLLRPEIYHPLTLLDVPPPFRVAALQPDPSTSLPDLVSSGNFRSAAIKAAQLLTSPDLSPSLPADIATIFSLIYTRLSCLTLCGQTALAAQEVKALEDLNSSYYRDGEGRHLVPWELRVLAVRLQGMGFNDARRGVMGYYELARECRLLLTSLKKSRPSISAEEGEAKIDELLEAEIKVWDTRLQELGVRVASALVEMEDLEGAARFLSTLSTTSSTLATQKALLYLCLGDVDAARSAISSPSSSGEENKVILALAHMADSDFSSAVTIWEELISSTSETEELPMYTQNLAVCLLYLGRMSEVRPLPLSPFSTFPPFPHFPSSPPSLISS
jgi:trafficking protein particle complex subunit 12